MFGGVCLRKEITVNESNSKVLVVFKIEEYDVGVHLKGERMEQV